MFGSGNDCGAARRSGLRERAVPGRTPMRRVRGLQIVARESSLRLFRIHDGVVEKMGIRVVSFEFENLRNESSSRPALDVNEDFERIANVGLDCPVRQFHSALQNATREARESLLCRVGMNCRERAGMARVQKLKQVERFPGADFSQNYAVRTMAQGGLQEVPDGHCR